MVTLTLNELQQMMDDFIMFTVPRAVSDEEYQRANGLRKNQVTIAKQYLAIIQDNPSVAGRTPVAELQEMIKNHETYWNDRRGRGDVEAENADALSYRIVEIAQELIDALKIVGMADRNR